jgi:hypothetical protein
LAFGRNPQSFFSLGPGGGFDNHVDSLSTHQGLSGECAPAGGRERNHRPRRGLAARAKLPALIRARGECALMERKGGRAPSTYEQASADLFRKVCDFFHPRRPTAADLTNRPALPSLWLSAWAHGLITILPTRRAAATRQGIHSCPKQVLAIGSQPAASPPAVRDGFAFPRRDDNTQPDPRRLGRSASEAARRRRGTGITSAGRSPSAEQSGGAAVSSGWRKHRH